MLKHCVHMKLKQLEWNWLIFLERKKFSLTFFVVDKPEWFHYDLQKHGEWKWTQNRGDNRLIGYITPACMRWVFICTPLGLCSQEVIPISNTAPHQGNSMQLFPCIQESNKYLYSIYPFLEGSIVKQRINDLLFWLAIYSMVIRESCIKN